MGFSLYAVEYGRIGQIEVGGVGGWLGFALGMAILYCLCTFSTSRVHVSGRIWTML